MTKEEMIEISIKVYDRLHSKPKFKLPVKDYFKEEIWQIKK